MAFESLAYRHSISLPELPDRWLPLVHLYDPDLPLFPIYYFHVLPETLSEGHRPSDTERAFGYIERINIVENTGAEVSIVLNKNLELSSNNEYLGPVTNGVKERLGVLNPVTHADVANAFESPLDVSNKVLSEMWHRVVSNAYGNKLPFGRLWDEVLGITRFVSSWYSPGGRKGELIQTHYFLSKFGVRIQSAGAIPQIDFYLLPTINELLDISNPLSNFPEYSQLLNIARQFQSNYCSTLSIDGIQLSRFNNPFSGKVNTERILSILNGNNIAYQDRTLAIECFNTFDKGPQRTIIFLMLLDDIRQNRIDPAILNSAQCGSIYDSLKSVSTYQSPKVVEIYAQQSYGNESAMPIDTWIETFMLWPLCIYPEGRRRGKYTYIFSHSNKLGKVERLLWVAGQARKVHSSACNNALWCLKYSSSSKPRGANPLACNICLDSIRSCCPAYAKIKDRQVCFNDELNEDVDFFVFTSEGNNTSPNQKFTQCDGWSIYKEIVDDFSPADDPDGYAPFPAVGHNGSVITVDEFVNIY